MRQPAHEATEQLVGKKVTIYWGDDNRATGIVGSVSFDRPYPSSTSKGDTTRPDGLRVAMSLKEIGYFYEASEFEVRDSEG